MRQYLLPQEGNFYKANLHCHTTVSDGSKTPEEIKAAYMARGYSAVAFTDHEIFLPHRELTDNGFVAIHGYETAVKQDQGRSTGDHMPVHHLCLLATDPAQDHQVCFYPENFTPGNCASYLPGVSYVGEICSYRYTEEFLNRLIEEANQNGFLVTYNHPRWSLQSPEGYARLQGLHGIEVHNTGCVYQGDCNGEPYDALLRRGARLLPIAADDNHNGGREAWEDSFGGFTMIKAEALTYRSLMQAYKRGDLYASSGPEIRELFIEDGTLHIETSPASQILLLGEGRYVALLTDRDGWRTEGDFLLDPARLGRFFRLEVWDRDGGRAYSRAYFLDELKSL